MKTFHELGRRKKAPRVEWDNAGPELGRGQGTAELDLTPPWISWMFSVFSFENKDVGQIISLVFPILWLGNSQWPIPLCHVRAVLTASAYTEFGNHTMWKENQVKEMRFTKLWRLGENSM